MNYFWIFLAGALLCNSIPHLTRGLQGHSFPTPFAKPSGVGHSSPLINFLWGSFNLFAGVFLLAQNIDTAYSDVGLTVMGIGFLAIGIFGALHFGKVERARQKT